MRVSTERDRSIVFCKLLDKYLFFPYKHSSIVDRLILRVLHPSLFSPPWFFWQSFSLTDSLLWGLNFITTYEIYLYIYAVKLKSPLHAFIQNFTSPLCALCFRIYFNFRNKIRRCFQKPRLSIEADTDGWPVFSIVLMDTLKLLMEFSLSPVLRWSQCRGLSLIN